MGWFLILLLGVPACAQAPGTWVRVEIPFTLNAGESPRKHLPGTMPGGAAVLDFDGDGLLDLFLPNGAPLPALEKQKPRDCHRLLRNTGNLRFTDVTQEAGLCGEGYGIGAAVADYDNDGRPDILVAGVGTLHLYRNLGNGRFEDVTAKSKLDNHGRWAITGSFADIDLDGDLDLFVANYVTWDPANEPECKHAGVLDYCHPRYFKPNPNALFENLGDGTFRDISKESGIAEHPAKGMSIATADFNGDGLPDFFVTNDRIFNHLFLSQGKKKYVESSFEWGVAAPSDGSSPSAMGAHAADFDNDGRIDLIYTALDDETFPIYRNTGTAFDDAGGSTRLAVLSRPMAGWGVWFADADNDGWLDLFVARGGVLSPDGPRGQANNEPLGLFLNRQGKSFQSAIDTSGFGQVMRQRHRAMIPADFDNDGCVDALVVPLNTPAFLMRNPCQPGSNWLKLRLRGTTSNRDGLGALVTLITPATRQTQYLASNGGYASALLAPLHFGLGSSKEARVEIRWPSGKKQVLESLAAGKTHLAEEPD